MSIAPNDVSVLAVETSDENFPAGSNIDIEVQAEVGSTLHGTGGKYQVQMAMADTTSPSQVDKQLVTGNYGDANWPAPGLQTFKFTVLGAKTTGRAGDLLEPQANIISNASAPFDSSQALGERILITP